MLIYNKANISRMKPKIRPNVTNKQYSARIARIVRAAKAGEPVTTKRNPFEAKSFAKVKFNPKKRKMPK